MATRGFLGLLSLLLVSSAIMPALVNAQLGEVAGQLILNVSLGSSNSIPFTIVNGGSTPIGFKVVLPTLTSKTANTVLPTVTVSPMNGTIQPRSEFQLNVTFTVPYGKQNAPGVVWTGILQAVEVSNGSTLTGSGANIQEGVAKLVQITATVPKPTLLPYIIGGVAAVVVVAGGALYFTKFRKPGKAAVKAKASKAAMQRQMELAKLAAQEKALRARRLALQRGKAPTVRKAGRRTPAKKVARKASRASPRRRRR